MPEVLDEHEAQNLAVVDSRFPLPALLPCPFCGNAGIHFDQPDEDRNVVGCRLGHVKMRSPEAWNTRAQEWRPIATMPADGAAFLVYCPGRKNIYEVFHYSHASKLHIWASGGRDLIETPTHWQPLPAPPREDE